MDRWGAIIWAAACAACYHPATETACAIACDPGGTPCPGTLACIGGLCRSGPNDTCMPTIDAPLRQDATPVGDGALCEIFGAAPLGPVVICPPPPATKLTFSGGIDTTSCSGTNQARVTVNGGAVCVLTAHELTISTAGIVATGALPLVLAADVLEIDGPIDVSSSTQNGRIGAGADVGCMQSGGPGSTGGGGGAGGSAGGAGGDGGAGGGGSAVAAASPPATLLALRGGCSGGTGDNGITGGTGGGGGGGALYLIGSQSLAINGPLMIAAGGGAGRGGLDLTGGGGAGGSGGLIALHTAVLAIASTPQICATGGGGGGGGNKNGNTPVGGSNGGDGCSSANGGGGGPGGTGGAGGIGNTSTSADGGAGSPSIGGGGGGGGAAGYVRVYGGASAATLNSFATVEPLAQ